MLSWVVNSRLQHQNSLRRSTSLFLYSFVSNRLAPLSPLLRTRSLCFQYFAASFPKTPGWVPAQSKKGKTMKAKTSKSILAPERCQHLSPAGRQCCSPAAAPGSTLCARHAAAAPPQSVDFSAELLDGCGDFQRAQQVNHSLIALYKLLAQGRISPRQASVLAYIGSLVLRSLKDVDYDLDRFDEESEDISAESDDEPGDERSPEPVAPPVAPGKEPLPATAEEF